MGPSCMHGVQEAWLAAIEHSESTSEEGDEGVSSALQLLGGTMGSDKMLEGQGDGGAINTIACGQPGVQLARALLVAGRSIDTCVCTVLLAVCLSVCLSVCQSACPACLRNKQSPSSSLLFHFWTPAIPRWHCHERFCLK